MTIEWDPKKAGSNFKKHGVRFSDAVGVLRDPNALSLEDTMSEEERRFVTIGMDYLFRLLLVVYTYRGENIRIISARPATRSERKAYESGI